MATCVVLNAEGTLQRTGEAADQCSGYVLLSGAENAQMEFLRDLFVWPEPAVVTGWLMGAMTLVLALNAVGYIVGAVVKMVSTERD